MADLTFKGTTNQVLLEIATTGGKIDKNTQVTITDNNYTSANLLTIINNATNGGTLTQKIVLEKPAAQSAMVDTALNLITIVGGVNKYTGALTANDSSITATQLNTIAGGTTGKVTATLVNTVTIDSATVIALENVKATDNITFAPTDTTLADNSDVRALISLSKTLPKANFAAVNSITTSDVSLAKQALVILKNNTAVAVDISAIELTATDANDIAKATKGELTATIKDGKVAETLKALSDVNAKDDISFTTTDRTVKASDLFNLGAKFQNIAQFDASSITTVTGEAKDVATLTAALTTAAAAGATITDTTVSGQITLTELAAIKAAGSGDLTATVEADTAASLLAKLTTATTTTADTLTLTVNGTTAAAGNLNNLLGLTGGKIKLDATTVSGLLADVQSVYITNKASFTALGNENIIINPAGTPTAAQLNAIAAATTGKVTATLDPTTALTQATVTVLKDVKTSDNITFAPTVGTLTGKDSMNALLAIKKILPNADFSAVADITGVDAKDATLVKNVLKLIDPASDVTFATGELSAKDANDIAKVLTTGKLTATIKDGGIAATLKALSDVNGALDVLKFKTTDKTASAKDIFALNTKLGSANTDFGNVKTVTGTAADAASGDIVAALGLATIAAVNPEVKISGTVDGTYIKAIIDATTGKVTATLEAADANTLASYLVDASVGQTVSNAINVTVNDTSVGDAGDLADIAAATSGKIKVESLEVKGSLADVSNVYITNKAKFTGLGNEDIDISATNDAAAVSVDALAKATSGILTADVADDQANNLVSQLKNANAKDALTITVLDNVVATSAKDLLTLDGKTSVTVIAGAVTAISGSVAEVNKLAGADVTVNPGVNYTISGTVKAADLNAIADTTTGVITATVAADTAQNLAYLLDSATLNNTDKLTLKVTGATAAAADLISLNAKTAEKITVDAKEVTGTLANVTTTVVTTATDFLNLGNKNIKITDTVTANATNLNNILVKTTGIVTATVAADTAANLATFVANATAKDALTLVTTNVAATAAQLLDLDDKTSVKVDATAIIANGITGSSAQLKKLVASKGVELASNVALTVDNTETVKAADLGAILKATSGNVSATVAADTAAKLNAALKDAISTDALKLTVDGTTATAKDLISLNDKTSAAISLDVGAIVGNVSELTDIFVTKTGFDAAELLATAATVSGTVGAGDYAALNTVLAAANTTGVVTATIQANDAATLNSTFTNATAADKLTFKVNGTTAVATDLTGLDAKTVVAVDASAIKNIDGASATGAAEVKAVVDAAKAGGISGLGNETVTFSTTTADASVALVKAINDFTSGVITLPDLVIAATDARTFNLNQLGDLNGITGLVEIDATTNTAVDTINISLNDILAANDGKTFAFDINNEAQDTVNLNIAGWSHDATDLDYTNGKTFTKGDVTIELTVADATGLVVL